MSLAELSKLPLREKLQIMDAIWVEMRSNAESMDISAEHRAMLDARRKRVADGKSSILDWNQARHSIGRK